MEMPEGWKRHASFQIYENRDKAIEENVFVCQLMKEMAEAAHMVEEVCIKPGMKDPFGSDWKWLYRIMDANKKFKEWK